MGNWGLDNNFYYTSIFQTKFYRCEGDIFYYQLNIVTIFRWYDVRIISKHNGAI